MCVPAPLWTMPAEFEQRVDEALRTWKGRHDPRPPHGSGLLTRQQSVVLALLRNSHKGLFHPDRNVRMPDPWLDFLDNAVQPLAAPLLSGTFPYDLASRLHRTQLATDTCLALLRGDRPWPPPKPARLDYFRSSYLRAYAAAWATTAKAPHLRRPEIRATEFVFRDMLRHTGAARWTAAANGVPADDLYNYLFEHLYASAHALVGCFTEGLGDFKPPIETRHEPCCEPTDGHGSTWGEEDEDFWDAPDSDGTVSEEEDEDSWDASDADGTTSEEEDEESWDASDPDGTTSREGNEGDRASDDKDNGGWHVESWRCWDPSDEDILGWVEELRDLFYRGACRCWERRPGPREATCLMRHSLAVWDPFETSLWFHCTRAVRGGWGAVLPQQCFSGMLIGIIRKDERYDLRSGNMVHYACDCGDVGTPVEKNAPVICRAPGCELALAFNDAFMYARRGWVVIADPFRSMRFWECRHPGCRRHSHSHNPDRELIHQRIYPCDPEDPLGKNTPCPFCGTTERGPKSVTAWLLP